MADVGHLTSFTDPTFTIGEEIPDASFKTEHRSNAPNGAGQHHPFRQEANRTFQLKTANQENVKSFESITIKDLRYNNRYKVALVS